MRFDFHYLLSGKHAQWLSLVLVAFFSVLILLEWSNLRLAPITAPATMEAVTIRPLPKAEDSAKLILNTSLFGVYVANDLNESTVKKSMLDVTLVGILFADKIENSQVIIRAANGQEKTYKTGDTIPGDAIIKRITANGILVEHDGALESLSLPKNELIFEPVAKPLKEE